MPSNSATEGKVFECQFRTKHQGCRNQRKQSQNRGHHSREFSGSSTRKVNRFNTVGVLARHSYIADTGVACAAQAISTPNTISAHPLTGALFETAVVGEIRKICSTMSTPPNLYHWRTHGGAEVDLLLERDGRFYPMEVKVKSSPSRADTTGITAFRKSYPGLRIEKGLVLAPTERLFPLSENDWAMPWDTL